MKTLVLTVTCLLFIATSGCYSYHIRSGALAAAPPTGQTGVTFVYGLVGTTAVAPECSTGLAYAETWQPWWAFFVTGLTLGLVTPWRAEWACALRTQVTTSIPTR